MINLRIKFRDIKKRVVLPIFSYEKGMFKIVLPIYGDNRELVDIVCINLPIQVVANPSKELYRFLRIRGVI